MFQDEMDRERMQEVVDQVEPLDEEMPKPTLYSCGPTAKFRGLDINVDSRVLIPRQETELLVDVAVGLSKGAKVHDVGTGSGAVAIAIKMERPDLEVTATDICSEALAVARANRDKFGLQIAMWEAIGLGNETSEIDLVVANLPYLTKDSVKERDESILDEPDVALFDSVADDGLGLIRLLITEMRSGSRVAVEHDTHHGPEVSAQLLEATTHWDQNGEDRMTIGVIP